MEDFLKRGLVVYVGLMVAFWLMSWGMELNHAAHISNLAWQIISGFRNFFTGVGVIGVGVASASSYFATIEARQKKRLDDLAQASEREKVRLECEERQIVQKFEEEKQRRVAEQAKIQNEKEHQEWLKQKRLEKQKRSAGAAARAALDDF